MAEIKNLFIKSKMNKDLDDRLVPPGEYRDARNVNISRSEGQDVGALENVLGNNLIPITQIKDSNNNIIPDLHIIGFYIDKTKDRIYTFLTDYEDNGGAIENFAPSPAYCFIYVYDIINNTYTKLVEGNFLNFSKSHTIIGVNLLEDLLFWTDNRNQPRKINVERAIVDSTYYTTEDQISVAKYYPYNPIKLWQYDGGQPVPNMENRADRYLPSNPSKSPTAYPNPTWQNDGDPTNPVSTYPGDPSFMEDKFMRFSYRFVYDDDEVSLMAPFTQIAFIPKQDGYFMCKVNNTGTYETLDTDEGETYRSTVVELMENKVDFVKLTIDLPTTQALLNSQYKVKKIDILSKESNSTVTYIVDSVIVEDFEAANSGLTYYDYDYFAGKPIKALAENQTTRVYDQVPIKALAQEIIGNRVVYGNYINRHNWPSSLGYKVGVSNKLETNVATADPLFSTSRVEYPNHTLKQNRNYQVGIVLADRFGRQSPVILSEDSSVLELVSQPGQVKQVEYGESTIYNPYYDDGTQPDVLEWPGKSLKVLFNDVIPPNATPNYPGIYSIDNPLGWYSYKVVVKQREQDYYNVYLPGMLNGYPDSTEGIGKNVHIVLINDNINKIPRDLQEVGPEQIEFNSSVRLSGRVTNRGLLSNSSFNYNRQYFPSTNKDETVAIGSMQDLGLAKAGLVRLSLMPIAIASGNSLWTKEYNPNITAGMMVTFPDTYSWAIGQYYRVISNTENPEYIEGSNIAGITQAKGLVKVDVNFPVAAGTPANGDIVVLSSSVFYSAETNPLIARISTSNNYNFSTSSPPLGTSITEASEVNPFLSVYETEPLESNIELFWESTTSGLISDLNSAIDDTGTSPAKLSLWDFELREDANINSFVTSPFQVWDSNNSAVSNVTLALGRVEDGMGRNRSNEFNLILHSPGWWKIQTTQYFMYDEDGALRNGQQFVFNFVATAPGLSNGQFSYIGNLGNNAPTIDVSNVNTTITQGDTNGGYFTSQNGSNSLNSERFSQLSMDLTSQFDIIDPTTPVTYFSTNSIITSTQAKCNINVDVNTPEGDYTIVLASTDANGFGTQTTSSITITVLPKQIDSLFTQTTYNFSTWEGGFIGWGNNMTAANDLEPIYGIGTLNNVPSPNNTTIRGATVDYFNTGTFGAIPQNTTLSTLTTTTTKKYIILENFVDAGGSGGVGTDRFYYNIKALNTTNTTRHVNGYSLTGLTQGTVIFTFRIRHPKRNSINQTFVLQHRFDDNSPWQNALDIRSDTFQGGDWDCKWDSTYNYRAALYSNAPVQADSDRLNYGQLGNVGVTGMFADGRWLSSLSSGMVGYSYDTVLPGPRGWNYTNLGWKPCKDALNHGGLNPWVGKPWDAATGIAGGGYVWPQAAIDSESKFVNNGNNPMVGTMNLTNYAQSGFGEQVGDYIYAERTFAVNRPGQYRLIIDNLRCGLYNSEFDKTDGCGGQTTKTFRSGPKNMYIDFGNSYVDVKDFYYSQPGETYYQYTVFLPSNGSTAYNAFASMTTGIIEGGTGITVYAKEPAFRYVKRFYTRTGTPGNYTYTPWGPTNTGYIIYTHSQTAIVDAGIPFGDEVAYGPHKGGGASGLHPLWTFQAAAVTGVKLTGNLPHSITGN